ncbi:hypothetical protein NJR55_12035 [Idiomarina sp. M1R2S28]|uniref:Uncharacterized protein n=1 Tax=Idiomarina rhizosphaerae TaxID=2961572 RepID=A0A9X2JTF7_9GAMM|nr:hypothetical protein [Idiomarina rhizosphaerae]MCP1340319.1 hypothetical protein [Idiomarina rhizosphaerae]
MPSSLDYQIEQAKQDLKLHKLAVKVRSKSVVSTTCDRLASPAVLGFAVGTGFFIGKMSDRPKKVKAPGEKKSPTNVVIKILRVFAGVQSASSFAKHL